MTETQTPISFRDRCRMIACTMFVEVGSRVHEPQQEAVRQYMIQRMEIFADEMMAPLAAMRDDVAIRCAALRALYGVDKNADAMESWYHALTPFVHDAEPTLERLVEAVSPADYDEDEDDNTEIEPIADGV